MASTPAWLGAWGVLSDGDRRNVSFLIQGTLSGNTSNVVDADFDEGRAMQIATGTDTTGDFVPVTIPSTTLADDDELHVTAAWKITARSGVVSDDTPIIQFYGDYHTGGGAEPSFGLIVQENAYTHPYDIRAFKTDGVNSVLFTAEDVFAATLNDVYITRVTIKRVSSTSARVAFAVWESGTWNEKASATGTHDSSKWNFRDLVWGNFFTGAKSQAGSIRFSRGIVSLNVIPAGTMLCDNAVLPETPDGSTYDEWTNSSGSDAFAMVDDAFNSESTSDYTEAGSGTTQATQELNIDDISDPGDDIRGIVLSVGVTTGPDPINGVAYLGTRLSSTDDLEDAYYGMTARNSLADQRWDTARFFEADPSGSAWSVSNINSATYLFQKKATGAATNWRIHAACLQVLHGDTWVAAEVATVVANPVVFAAGNVAVM